MKLWFLLVIYTCCNQLERVLQILYQCIRCLNFTVSAGNWDKLPPREKQEKERFLSGEQRASKGFMTQANTQMELLYNMSEAEAVARCLCDPSLAKRTAAAVSSGYQHTYM